LKSFWTAKSYPGRQMASWIVASITGSMKPADFLLVATYVWLFACRYAERIIDGGALGSQGSASISGKQNGARSPNLQVISPTWPIGPRPFYLEIGSLNLHEYMGEDEYRFSNDVVSVYPTVSISGRTTYRPTNEFCLMRNVSIRNAIRQSAAHV
jgi:hypothetical protein